MRQSRRRQRLRARGRSRETGCRQASTASACLALGSSVSASRTLAATILLAHNGSESTWYCRTWLGVQLAEREPMRREDYVSALEWWIHSYRPMHTRDPFQIGVYRVGHLYKILRDASAPFGG